MIYNKQVVLQATNMGEQPDFLSLAGERREARPQTCTLVQPVEAELGRKGLWPF